MLFSPILSRLGVTCITLPNPHHCTRPTSRTASRILFRCSLQWVSFAVRQLYPCTPKCEKTFLRLVRLHKHHHHAVKAYCATHGCARSSRGLLSLFSPDFTQAYLFILSLLPLGSLNMQAYSCTMASGTMAKNCPHRWQCSVSRVSEHPQGDCVYPTKSCQRLPPGLPTERSCAVCCAVVCTQEVP